MKKFVCVLLVISLLALGLTGCGGGSEDAAGDVEQSNNKESEGDTYLIRVGHTLQEDTPTHKAFLDFKSYVEKESEGKIEIEVYPNSALGSERQMVEATQLGTLEVSLATTAVLANFDPKLTVFELPFLYNNLDIARKSVDGELTKVATEDLSKVNLKSLTLLENGFRNVTNSQRPIHTPEDMQGLKIRTMENPIHMETFKLMGASPTPMAFTELYTALQQGTVDAQENPIFLIYTSKFQEVQDYLSLTGHIYASGGMVINLDFWNSLPGNLQQIVQDGAYHARDVQRDFMDEQNKQNLEELKKVMTVNELTAEEKAAFIEATKPVYDQVADMVGQELVDLAVSANETYK